MDPQAPSQAPQQSMPQPPEAPPDAFGGALQAIALGFAAGFGGKTVSDQIAQQRQNSWEAWQRNQEAKLRREEMDRRDRQFAMSLDMQRTEMEYRKSRDMKDDEARDKAKMEADIGTDAARISAEADLGPLDPNLPMSEVNRKLEDKRVGSLEMRAITREDMKANAQATEKAADRQLTIDLEGKRGEREAAALKQRDEESKRQFAVQRAEIALKGMQVGAADRANVVQIGYALAEKAATIYGRPWSEFVDSSMARARQDLEAGGSDALKALMANLDSEASTLGNDAASGFGKPTDSRPSAPDSRPAAAPDSRPAANPAPRPAASLQFGSLSRNTDDPYVTDAPLRSDAGNQAPVDTAPQALKSANTGRLYEMMRMLSDKGFAKTLSFAELRKHETAIATELVKRHEIDAEGALGRKTPRSLVDEARDLAANESERAAESKAFKADVERREMAKKIPLLALERRAAEDKATTLSAAKQALSTTARGNTSRLRDFVAREWRFRSVGDAEPTEDDLARLAVEMTNAKSSDSYFEIAMRLRKKMEKDAQRGK